MFTYIWMVLRRCKLARINKFIIINKTRNIFSKRQFRSTLSILIKYSTSYKRSNFRPYTLSRRLFPFRCRTIISTGHTIIRLCC
ncbi:hypothetical protein O3M35_012937 [Rhynocoris fuscipes]|uniref:Uncharacterized protein n=1 Tax=Rhynocoris fuscipes TaxID=488301 RepID=A0AAW1CKR2_9HEMI